MEENGIVETSPIDLTEVTDQLELLTETLTEEKTVLVDDVEMTSNDLLLEILTTLQPDEEILKEQAEQQAEQEEQELSLLEEEAQFRETLLQELQALNENVVQFNENSESILKHQENEMVLYSMEYYSAMCIIIFACLIPLFWIVKQFKTILNWFI